MDKIRQNEKIALFFQKKSALRALCFAVTEGNLRTTAREGGKDKDLDVIYITLAWLSVSPLF